MPTIRRSACICVFVLGIVPYAFAGDGLVIKPSSYPVAETLDRLEKILKDKGLTVFARVDHSAGAASVGQELPPAQVLIFGNPKMGTALMRSRQTVGIDLPMKVLAWQDAAGRVSIAYNDPIYLAKRHGIVDREDVVTQMTGALGKLTDLAVRGP